MSTDDLVETIVYHWQHQSYIPWPSLTEETANRMAYAAVVIVLDSLFPHLDPEEELTPEYLNTLLSRRFDPEDPHADA